MAPKTIFLDIDGCIFTHIGNLSNIIKDDVIDKQKLLPGVLEKINQWESEGCKIILVSGRKASMKEMTEQQLQKHGVFYDLLILGVGGGPRVLINDMKPDRTQTAFAINLTRDHGLADIIL